jgi:DNA polymerase I-like protein with 3'-5' exonuclease and polymerase domains
MTDKEQADEFRKKFNSMALPLVGLLMEVERKGFSISFNIAVRDGKPDLKCDIAKVTKL